MESIILASASPRRKELLSQIGIEYDGLVYHTKKSREKENKKDEYYTSQNIRIIRIKEYKDSIDEEKQNIIYYEFNSTYTHLKEAILTLFEKLICFDESVITPDININRDAAKIMESYLSIEKDNSITQLYPHLMKEWDYGGNGLLKPEYIQSQATQKLWWVCGQGHHYQMSPAKRTQRNQGCPYCSGRYATKEHNLKLVNPSLSEEWNCFRNKDKEPDQFTPMSGQKVWW